MMEDRTCYNSDTMMEDRTMIDDISGRWNRISRARNRPNISNAATGNREKLAGNRMGTMNGSGDQEGNGNDIWTMHWDRWNAMGMMADSRNRSRNRIRIAEDRMGTMGTGNEWG